MENLHTKLMCWLILFLSFAVSNISLSQSISGGELMIVNNSETVSPKFVKINIYPVGAVFSGGFQYSLEARHSISPQAPFNKIYGYSDILNHDKALPEQNWTSKINFDSDGNISNCKISIGYGKYRIDFYEGPTPDNFTFADYCYVDFSDANYGTANFQGEQKFRIDYRASSNITFNFLSSSTLNNINLVGKDIRVWDQYGSGFSPVSPSKGMFNDTTIAGYRNFPIDAKLFGAIDHINPADFGLNMTVKYQGAGTRQNQTLNFINSSLTINEDIVFNIDQNREMNFAGKNAKFITNNNSQILSPENFVIRIKDSACILLTGSKFLKNTSAVSWGGFRMENVSELSYIDNCLFEYADTAVSLTNQRTKPFMFRNNTVKVFRTSPTFKRMGLLFRNCSYLLIQNNKFYLPDGFNDLTYEFGIHLTNFENYVQGDSYYNIIITDNVFSKGVYQMDILGYASNLNPVYISGNSFTSGHHSIVLRRCSGTIKNNNITNTVPPIFLNNSSVILSQSQINFLSNYIEYPEYNIISSGRSYTNLAPIMSSNNKMVWIGGYNIISNLLRDNIYSDNRGYIFVNQGKNSFKINNASSRHIFGLLNDTSTFFYANGNCWYGNNNVANIAVYRTDLYVNQIPFQATPGVNCQILPDAPGVMLFEKGFGIKDTVVIASNHTSIQPDDDEISFANALKHESNSKLHQAINSLKNLINNYPDSKYLNLSVFKLYELYNRLDTVDNLSYRNSLFGELKSFLEDKIVQYQNNDEFVKNAYDVVLMCATIRREFNEALDGYEYVALNDPDLSVRILAASDYLTVHSLINGTGGGENSKRINRKFGDEKPLNKIIERSFGRDKIKSERIHTKDHVESYSGKVINEKINSRVSELLNSKSLNDEEKIKKIEQESMSVINLSYLNNNADKNSVTAARDYILSQNYPNPFNPVTKISYTVLKEGLVTIKVYDILGKEIATLVNENRTSGRFDVEFNGSNLTSGIYFYKITAGNFTDIKQMILIK